MYHQSIYDEPDVRVATTADVEKVATDVAGLRAQLAGLVSTADWIRFITDAKGCKQRAEELVGLTTTAIEAVTAAEHKQAAAELRVAELDAREAALKNAEDEFASERIEFANEVKAARESWQPRRDALDAREHRITRFVLRALGRDHPLQDVPSLDALENELFGRPSDDGAQPARDHGTGETEPVVMVQGSTLTRSPPSQRRSMRRGGLNKGE